MPPKKPKAGKKEEVVDIPKPHLLPDGPKSYFVGGWSKYQNLTSIGEIVQNDPGAENVFLLAPGTEEQPGAGASRAASRLDGKETPVEGEEEEEVAPATPIADAPPPTEAIARLRPVKIVGLLSVTKKAAPVAKAEGGEEGEEGGAAEADAGAEGEEAEEGAVKTTAADKVLLADRSVTIKGDICLKGAPPPVAKVEVAEPEKEEKAPAGKKGKKTAVVKEDPAEVAAREAAAAAAREAVERENEKGKASPSKWPTVEIQNLFFDGAVTIKGVHINFTNCHFTGGATNGLNVHQYVSVTLTKCSFAAPIKAALYCYPKSNVTVTDSIFAGDLLPQNEEEVAQAKLDRATAPQEIPSAVDNVNNVGLFVDDAKVVVSDCLFENLATGVLFNDKSDDSSLTSCCVRRCRNTGIMCNGTNATIKECQVSQCGYYSLRFEGRCSGKVLRNTVAGAAVKVGSGAHPFLHSNNLSSRLLDINEKGTISLEPRY